jgi:hypothetical protein
LIGVGTARNIICHSGGIFLQPGTVLVLKKDASGMTCYLEEGKTSWGKTIKLSEQWFCP